MHPVDPATTGYNAYMSESIRTPIGKAWVDDEGILWHRLDFGVTISGEDATETVRVLSDFLGGRSAPAIVDIGDVRFADGEAREVFARLGSEGTEVATAILVKVANPASLALTSLFATLEPDRPIEVFHYEEEAVEWARRHLRSPDQHGLERRL
jgi:hypothetical protein